MKKEKVLKLLVKWGNTESDAMTMIEANYDLAIRCYPDARPAKIAEALINF